MLRYAVDTNVLLSLAYPSHEEHGRVVAAIRRLWLSDTDLCFTPQNLGEFWNVSTRPRERNGFGLTVLDTEAHVQTIEETMTLLQEDERAYLAWRRLLFTLGVRGVQVHDAHLAAVLQVHRVRYLLTLNGRDFERFPDLVAVHPRDVR